jgi:hypothetical protein
LLGGDDAVQPHHRQERATAAKRPRQPTHNPGAFRHQTALDQAVM